MSKSIMQHNEGEVCYITGGRYNLDCHHQRVMTGTANRKLSEKYGLKVWLKHDIHMRLHDSDKELEIRLKQDAQRAFEELYGHDMWMSIFKKNYL